MSSKLAGHTKLPWHYKCARFPVDGKLDYGISAKINGQQYCIAEAFGRCATDVYLPAEANAALIVLAVNNHEALVEAITEAIDLLIERKHGSNARSPGHNARLVLQRALASARNGEGR